MARLGARPLSRLITALTLRRCETHAGRHRRWLQLTETSEGPAHSVAGIRAYTTRHACQANFPQSCRSWRFQCCLPVRYVQPHDRKFRATTAGSISRSTRAAFWTTRFNSCSLWFHVASGKERVGADEDEKHNCACRALSVPSGISVKYASINVRKVGSTAS